MKNETERKMYRKRYHLRAACVHIPSLASAYLLLLCVSGMFPMCLQAQDFHEPAEILQIMEKSTLKFHVNMSNEDLRNQTIWGPENSPMTYSRIEDGVPGIATYNLDSVTRPLFEAAEADLAALRFADARSNYLKINEYRPDIAVIGTFIGKTYDEQGNPTEAMKWYHQAIDLNYHDYLAHWLLADDLYALKQYSAAAQECAIAWVLNRNAVAIQQSAALIFKADRRQFSAFEFEPNYRLEKVDHVVEIYMDTDWMFYAYCKALWAYEPGYHRELGGGRSDFDMTEEKECLLNLAMVYDRVHKGKGGKNASIDALVAAIQRKMINEFIFVEEWLRIEPLIVYTQPKEAIASLAEYILCIRAPKK
jgi:tetratricopeptide (TPR) repeat protein